MKKKHITDIWNLNRKGHENYDFIDAVVNDDNELFIDPCLLEKSKDEWSKKAMMYINSFMNMLFKAFYDEDLAKMKHLLSHAGEQNATRLGYGNGDNGKGNTADGLLIVFQPLENLIKQIKTIGKVEDLALMIPGFAEDGMSDLLTNIFHDCLNEFTLDQMRKFGIPSNGECEFFTWDLQQTEWIKVKKKSYLIDGKELLLVPKHIVRKNYLFGVNQYFTRIILERIIDEGGYRDSDGKSIPKKEILKSKRFSGDHWLYNEVIQYTITHNDALEEYHTKLPGFYLEYGQPMMDEELDFEIYGAIIAKSA